MDREPKFFYANGVEMAVSAYDFNLKFVRQGAPSGATPGTAVTAERLDELTVTMSPAHAKTLIGVFIKSVHDYEKNIGKIVLPGDEEEKFHDAINSLK